MKITLQMSKAAYMTACKVYSGDLTRTEGKKEINMLTGMNEGSAQAFITIFLAMMNGSVYKRAFNNATNQFLLEAIKEDFGQDYFDRAISAAQQHIDYFSTLGKGNLSGFQRIIDQMM